MFCSNRWVTATIAGFLLGLLIFVYSAAPDFFQNQLFPKKQNLVIQESSQLYESWVEPPVTIYHQFYFFNVDNPDDVNDGRLPVRLTQQGPYAFRKILKKTNITFDSKGTVSYILRKWYVFEPALSNGFLNDTITIPNVPLMSVGKDSENHAFSNFEVFVLNYSIPVYRTRMFVHCTIGELLFDGYYDKFIDFTSRMKLRNSDEEIFPDGKFAFFYKANGTGQTFLVNTGVDDFSSLGVVKSWTNTEILIFTNGFMTIAYIFNYFNGKHFLFGSAVNSSEIRDGTHDSLSYWNDTLCDAIDGTDGSRFPPPITKDQVLRMFSDELCRSVYVRFDRETKVHGISTLRFTLPQELMENSPENRCFFAEQESDPLDSGMLNVSVWKIPQRLIFPVFWINESVEIASDKVEALRSKLLP